MSWITHPFYINALFAQAWPSDEGSFDLFRLG
jgi:hypothetical protein